MRYTFSQVAHDMMRLIKSILTLVLTLWWLIPVLNSAHAGEIAVLKSADLPYYEQAIAGFKAELSGTTSIKDYNLYGQLEQGREIAKSLRASPPDLVLAVGLKAAMAAKLEIFDTPVVFCMVLNPETYGLPTSNMTGVAVRTSAEIQLSALHSMMPDRNRIGILYDENQSGTFVHDAFQATKRLGLDLVAVPIHRPDDIPIAVRALLPKVDVLWLIQDQLVVSESAIPFFLESTLSAKIPLFTFSSTLVQQGALGALVLDPWTVGQQTARIARARLKEHRTSGGYIEPPEHPQLALNLNSAEYLGITLTPEVIRLASHVFSGLGTMARHPAHQNPIP